MNSRLSTLLATAMALLCGVLTVHYRAKAATVSIEPTTSTSMATTKLTVTTSFSSAAVSTPANVSWTLIITNTGSTVAKRVAVDNLLPIQFASAPSASTELKSLGDLAPGDTIVKTFPVTVPTGVTSNRYVDEATISAANVDPQESDAAIDVNAGRVLGATDSTVTTLAETGKSPIGFVLVGLLFVGLGLKLRLS